MTDTILGADPFAGSGLANMAKHLTPPLGAASVQSPLDISDTGQIDGMRPV